MTVHEGSLSGEVWVMTKSNHAVLIRIKANVAIQQFACHHNHNYIPTKRESERETSDHHTEHVYT